MFNCHTHIFNDEHVPEHFLPPVLKPLVPLVENGKVTDYIRKKLKKWNMEEYAEQIERFHAFAVHSASKPESTTIDNLLKPFYPPGTRFIILTMDMEYMEAGKPRRSYINQLDTLAQLTRMQQYKDIIHPFVAADPRRPGVFEEVRRRIEKDNYWGIKLYPPLGYFPFDGRFKDMYTWAEDNQIPIMTHCSRGGVFYRGSIPPRHPVTNEPMYGSNNDQKSENYTDPDNYKYVLEKYYDLKICFAHYGGQGEWALKNNNPPLRCWPDAINEMLRNPKYPNLFTDISYTLYDTNMLTRLRGYLADPKLKSKIMYGTDFYMETQETTEERFYKNVLNGVLPADWQAISETNVRAYLNSKIRQVVP